MIIVCWNMQGSGYSGADAFAQLVAGWGVDVVILLEPPDWAHNTRAVGSARHGQWQMQYWAQHAGDKPDKHHGAITTLAAPGVTVKRKGELYPDPGMEMPRQLLVFKITKGDDVRRVASCHAPFGRGAFFHYVRHSVKEFATFSETPHGPKKHVHPVDIWIGDLTTAGNHSPKPDEWVLKFARATTRSGASGGSPRDKVLVRAASDLAANARAGRVLGRNAAQEADDWKIDAWDMETSSDHCPVYIDTGGAARLAAAAAAAPAAAPRRSLFSEYEAINKKAREEDRK